MMTMEDPRPTHRRRRGAAVIAPTEPPPGHDHLVDQVRAYPRRRNYLLPALQDVQIDLGWLPPWSIGTSSGSPFESKRTMMLPP